MLLIALLGALLVVLLLVRFALGKTSTSNTEVNPAQKLSGKKAKRGNATDLSEASDGWMDTVSETVATTDSQGWEWGEAAGGDGETSSVAVQEVDLLTEYQVYKQFGYEDKAASSLANYLNNLSTPVPEKLVHELANLSLRTGNIDLLAHTLDKYADALPSESLAEYVKAGLSADTNNLSLRVLADSKLSWDMKEVSHQIGEQTGLDVPHSNEPNSIQAEVSSSIELAYQNRNIHKKPMIVGQTELDDITEEELGAVMGFVKPDQSAKLLKNKVDYPTAIRQYDKAIQSSQRPAALIIDALKLDYQHNEVNQFAGHLWRLYYSLGQYGRQVKERMLGWGYSLGHHDLFDDLEKGPSEQQIREIGLAKGYIQPTTRQIKAKYRELVHQDDSMVSEGGSPAEVALKEVESLLMYGQLDQAIGTLEQSVLQYPQESQLYITLFDLYERSEDWSRLEQFLKLLRERVSNLPEEVVLAMSQLLQRVNRHSK